MSLLYGFSGFGGIVASGLKVTGSGSGWISLSPAPSPSCPGDLEVRRPPGAKGLREFLGTVSSKSGNKYNLSYGGLNKKAGYEPPHNGESVILWCTGKGGSSPATSVVESITGGGDGGIPSGLIGTIAIIVGAILISRML